MKKAFGYSMLWMSFLFLWIYSNSACAKSLIDISKNSSIEAKTQRENIVEAKTDSAQALPAEPSKVPPKTESTIFNRQFGLGLAIVPADLTSVLVDHHIYTGYVGGLQLNLLGRLHPYITTEFSFSGLGLYFQYNAQSYPIVSLEFNVSVGARFFLKDVPLSHGFSFRPYLVAALQTRVRVLEADIDPLTHAVEREVIFGFVPGVGFQFDFRRHFAFHFDLRTLLAGIVYSHDVTGSFVTGISANLGASYYF